MHHYESDVPEGWVTTVLDELATFGGGKTPSMDHKEYWNNGKYLWITSKDMKFAHITDSILKISDIALEEMTTYGKGTLLMVTRSGILRHTLPIAILDVQATVNQDIKTISCYVHEVHKYLYYAIKAQEAHILENYHKDGTTVDSIDLDRFKKLSIHLPPLSEQQRIVEEIEHWFTFIDTIEQSKVNLQTAIKQTKSKILDLAIHGKLVPQDPNDEPASELLKRINPKTQITCDNGHSRKLPPNWIFTKIKNVFKINPRTQADDDMDVAFVPMANISDGFRSLFTYDIRKWGGIKSGFTHFQNGDIAVAKISPCLENRKSVVFNSLPNGLGAGTTELHIFRPLGIDVFYALYFFKSNSFIKLCVGSFNGVVGQQRIGKAIIENISFPLPPLAEQKRIVRKIEDLFSLINIIEMELDE